jgi:Protein of unknown function (DUF1566)
MNLGEQMRFVNSYFLAFCLSVFTQSIIAQTTCTFFEGFVDNDNGTVTDPRNGLIWKRCAEGSNWDGATCSVAAKKLNWFDAMAYAKSHRYLSTNGWRLPSRDEFLSVVGTADSCKPSHYQNGRFNFAASKMLAHSVDGTDNFPGIFFSTTPAENDEKIVWTANFAIGMSTSSGFRTNENNVRLVLDANQDKSKKPTDFGVESAKSNSYKKSIEKYREEKAKANAKSNSEYVASSVPQPLGRGGVIELTRLSTGGFSAACKDGTRQVIYEDKLSSGEMRYSNRRSSFANANFTLVAQDACK